MSYFGAIRVTALPGATASGSLTNPDDAVTIDVIGMGQVLAHISGTYAGAVIYLELSPDGGTTWIAGTGYDVTFGGTDSSHATGTGEITLTVNTTVGYVVRTGGATKMRVRLDSITGGPLAVLLSVGPQSPSDPLVTIQGAVSVTASPALSVFQAPTDVVGVSNTNVTADGNYDQAIDLYGLGQSNNYIGVGVDRDTLVADVEILVDYYDGLGYLAPRQSPWHSLTGFGQPGSSGAGWFFIDATGIVGIRVVVSGYASGSGVVYFLLTNYAPGFDDAMRKTTTAVNPFAVESAGSTQILLGANGLRRGLILNNTDENVAYVTYGPTSSLAAFTAAIPPVAADGTPGYWEMPEPVYPGELSVVWGSDGSGSLIGTEL